MPEISVIIPCYNAEIFLYETINSVLNQTYEDFEVVCVDDGSIDGSINIIEEFIECDERVKLFNNPGKGASAARNYGLLKSKGKYIQFLDADDVLLRHKFEKQIQYFSDEVDIVVSDYQKRNKDLTKIIETCTFSEVTDNFLYHAICKIILTGNPLYKKKMFN